MRFVLFVLSVVAATTVLNTPTKAENYPWCAIYGGGNNGGATNCGFTTIQQCQATVSAAILRACVVPLKDLITIRWCTWARPRANVTAKWRMNRRTVATTVVGAHIIHLRTGISDAMMMFGCGPCWEYGAKNNCSRKRKFG